MIKRSYLKFFKSLGRIFLLTVSAALVINLVTPNRSFSDKENRVLQGRPEVKRDQLLSGRYSSKFESYVNDQFVLRDLWVSLKAGCDQLLGKVENSGVYLGHDGYLLEAFHAPDSEQLQRTMQAMTDFAASYSEIPQYALIAPNAVNILSYNLPIAAPVDNQNLYLDQLRDTVESAGIHFIDVRDTLRDHTDEQLYYRTDHHWTTQAAYYAYLASASALNYDPSIMTYEKHPASKAFQGTLSAKSGFRSNETDELDVFLPTEENAPLSLVNYISEQRRVGSFYDTSHLKTRDKYAMFFDGNHSKVEITTPSSENRTLLILKDSYANCFVPFLAPHYSKIIMIDPRYFTNDLGTIIQAENVDQILYLYNANTFFGDTSLEMTLTTASSPENSGSVNVEETLESVPDSSDSEDNYTDEAEESSDL